MEPLSLSSRGHWSGHPWHAWEIREINSDGPPSLCYTVQAEWWGLPSTTEFPITNLSQMFTAKVRSALRLSWGFSGKESACLGWGRSPGGGLGTHCSVLTWRSHGQRSLEGYSPWDCKELDTTNLLSACAHTHTHTHTHSGDPAQIQEPRLSGTRCLSHPPLSLFSPC